MIFCFKCTDTIFDGKPVVYKCVKGKIYHKDGETLIESIKYRGRKCSVDKRNNEISESK